MKIVLINMPITYAVAPGKQPPIGLLYLATVLELFSHNVEVCDFAGTSEEDCVVPLADVYGITATSVQLQQANRWAKMLKQINREAKVLLGGPGTIAEDLIDKSCIDAICVGDGEKSILKMIEDIHWNKLMSKYYFPVAELDQIPIPDRSFLKNDAQSLIYGQENVKSALIITIRGCPFKCAFCTSPAIKDLGGSSLRYRSVKNIEHEIGYLKNLGINQIGFTDDMFTARKDRAIAICKMLKDYGMTWKVFCRVRPFDAELANIMKDCGCKEIAFGIESFDQGVLNILKKSSTVEDNIRALAISADAGLYTKALFMIRTPGQSRRTMDINREVIEKVKFDLISCHNYIPLPGSDIWNHPHEYGIEILDRDTDKYNFYLYGKNGRNKWNSLIKPFERNLDEFNQESEDFVNYIENKFKMNRG